MSFIPVSRFAFLLILLFCLPLLSVSQSGVSREGPFTDDNEVITTLDTIYSCPDTIWVPIRVHNMMGVGSISLRFTFDPAVISYDNYYFNVHPALFSGFLVLNNAPLNTITIAWYSVVPASVMDGTMLTFRFNYLGGATVLEWDTIVSLYTNVSSIEKAAIYHNGYVSSFGYTAELTENPVDLDVCEGSEAVFTLGSLFGNTYTWEVSTDGGTSWSAVPATPPYTGNTNDTLVISPVPLLFNNNLYRCTVAGQCPPNPVSLPALLEVQALPVADAGPDAEICEGDSITLAGSASNQASITWSTSGTGSFTGITTSTPVYTPSLADIQLGSVKLSMVLEGIFPCGMVSDTMILTIYPIPLANAGNDTVICEGGTATLHGSGGSSYLWSTVPPLTDPVINVNPTTSTTYYLTVSNFGCMGYDQALVTVQPNPAVNAGPDASICAGETYVVNGTSQNSSAVQWSGTGDGNFLSQGQLTTTYTPGPGDIMNGSVYLVLSALPTSPCAVPARDTLLLTIIPLPQANAGNNVSICYGINTTLTATGGTAFTWNTVPPVTTASITVSPSQSTTYIVTVSNQQCSAVDSVRVTVLPLPVISISNDTMICFGHSVTLAASGGLSYAWSSGNITSAITVQPQLNTTYLVTVTALNGCQDVDSVEVVVNANLTSEVTPPDPSICAGGSVTLTASSNHFCTYAWTPATGLSNTSGPVVVANPGITTAYEMIATDNMGCSSVTKVTLLVHQNPPVEVQPPVVNLCRGDTVALTAYGANTYYWSPPTGLSANNTAVVLASPKNSVTYDLTGTDIYNCKATVKVVINVLPVPVVNLPASVYVCRGEKYLLDGNGHLDSCSYVWQDHSSSSYYYVTEPGWYYVTVDRQGCIVTDTTEILPCSELFIPNAFSPNNDGTNDYFRVVHNGDIIEFEMSIYNRWGELVFHTLDINEPWDGNYEDKRAPVGVYHYVIEYLGQGNVLLEKEGKKYGQITLFR